MRRQYATQEAKALEELRAVEAKLGEATTRVGELEKERDEAIEMAIFAAEEAQGAARAAANARQDAEAHARGVVAAGKAELASVMVRLEHQHALQGQVEGLVQPLREQLHQQYERAGYGLSPHGSNLERARRLAAAPEGWSSPAAAATEAEQRKQGLEMDVDVARQIGSYRSGASNHAHQRAVAASPSLLSPASTASQPFALAYTPAAAAAAAAAARSAAQIHGAAGDAPPASKRGIGSSGSGGGGDGVRIGSMLGADPRLLQSEQMRLDAERLLSSI